MIAGAIVVLTRFYSSQWQTVANVFTRLARYSCYETKTTRLVRQFNPLQGHKKNSKQSFLKMSCVHYMFSSMPKSSYIMFDGTGINLSELKTKIMKKEKLTAQHSALLVFNPQTNKEYTEGETLIAKNSSVVVKRIPPQPANRTFGLDKAGPSFGTMKDKKSNASKTIKRCTGIPRSFLVEVDDPSVKGAMLTRDGIYAVPMINKKAYTVLKKENHPFLPQEISSFDESIPVPSELLCPICNELLTDAVIIPCCGFSYCDECIRTYLLESKDHMCPNCNAARVSPDTLCSNKALRDTVNNFWKAKPTPQNDSDLLTDQASITLEYSSVTVSSMVPLTNGNGQEQPRNEHYISKSADPMTQRPRDHGSTHVWEVYCNRGHGGKEQRQRHYFKSKFSRPPYYSSYDTRRQGSNSYPLSHGQPGGSQCCHFTGSFSVTTDPITASPLQLPVVEKTAPTPKRKDFQPYVWAHLMPDKKYTGKWKREQIH